MKKLNISALFFIAVCLTALPLVLTACSDGSESSGLPIKTINYEMKNDGFVQFYTNNPEDYNVICFCPLENTENLNEFEIACNKKSGAVGFEYGLIFDCVKTGSNFTYIFVGITANGAYCIWERIPGGWNDITKQNYITSDKIITGTNKTNKIKIKRTDENFSVYINDAFINTYNKPRQNGLYGLFTFVGTEEYEDFPNTPVDVRFKVIK